MELLSVKIPGETRRRLERAARDRNASKSAIVREALERYFDANSKGSGTGLDKIRDLVGCLSGPVDLATNKKYLKGYGR